MKKSYPTNLIRLGAIAAIVLAQYYPAPTHAAEVSDDELKALIKRIDDLEKEVKELKQGHEQNGAPANYQAIAEEAAEKAVAKAGTNAPTVTLGASGLNIRSADNNFNMIVHGYAQTDYRAYFGQKSTPDEFLLRRIRPIIEGTVWKDYNYRLMLDLASGSLSANNANNVSILDDAYVNAHFWSEAQIQVGKYKAPIGLERLQSTAELFFVETGYATQLTPNYDLGAMLHNDYFNEPIGYAIGIFDGAADNASEDADSDEGKDIDGRLFLQPFLRTKIAPLKNLGFGVAGSIGTHTAGSLVSYKSPGQQTVYSYSTNVTGFTGSQYRIDPQAYYFWGPFGLQAEYILSSQKFTTTSAAEPRVRFNNAAWQVEGSYFLTGEENSFKASSYKHVVPLHRFGLGNGDGWGAFEAVARIQQLSLDGNSFHPVGGKVFATGARQATSWSVGLNWYLNADLKLNLDYENTTFNGGSAVAATKAQEHAILSRVQFQF